MKLKSFREDDFIAFYSSLRPVQGGCAICGRLIYALIGLFVLARPPRNASEIPASEHCHNAHTRWRRVDPADNDIVVNAKPELSGLLRAVHPHRLLVRQRLPS